MQELKPIVVLTPVAKVKLQEVMAAEKDAGSFLKIDVFAGGGCACS
jgi:hypothetical protein